MSKGEPFRRNGDDAKVLAELINNGTVPEDMSAADVKTANEKLFGRFEQTSFRNGLKHVRAIVAGLVPTPFNWGITNWGTDVGNPPTRKLSLGARA